MSTNFQPQSELVDALNVIEEVSKQKILIIDDDPSLRDFLSLILTDLANIETAPEGEAGLTIAREIKPDLIILDIEMPGIDGYEICRQLKASDDTADIPVIFITAQESVQDEEKGLKIGAIDYIRKPFSRGIVHTRVGNHLKLQQLTMKLEHLASTDPLTGAYNRRYFLSAARDEARRSVRYRRPLTLLMLDIDHFKQVNDNYGHDVGDEALKSTVNVISHCLRDQDVLGRFGGEEFIVLLPETDAAGAKLVAQRIRQMVSEMVLDTEQGQLKFTISIGVTEFMDQDTIESAQKRADIALYDAKEHGRDRVVLSTSEEIRGAS